MPNFNSKGYLEPYEAIEIDLVSAEELLLWNEARREIWHNFKAFLEELEEVLQSSFVIWLNGSFVSKKEQPNDLDLVIFTDFRAYEATITKLLQLKQKYKKAKIDSYFTPHYPEKHEKKYIYELDKRDWFWLFSHSRRDIFSGVISKKGFLELKF